MPKGGALGTGSQTPVRKRMLAVAVSEFRKTPQCLVQSHSPRRVWDSTP